MITDIVKIGSMFVLTYAVTRILFKDAAIFVKWLFIVSLLLTIGPIFVRFFDDIHALSDTYSNISNVGSTIGRSVDEITSLPEKADQLAGLKVTKTPPAVTLAEKLWGFGKGYFIYPVQGEITQGFSDSHHGLDIACNEDTPINVARQGKVQEIGNHEVYGNYILIDHGGGWQTLYAHLNKTLVRQGQNIFPNDFIAWSGDTGRSTGPHLHFEIRVAGKAIDPKEWMK